MASDLNSVLASKRTRGAEDGEKNLVDVAAAEQEGAGGAYTHAVAEAFADWCPTAGLEPMMPLRGSNP